MRLKKYNEYILLEKVYLSRTIFKKYELIVDPYSKVGNFKLELRGGYGKMDMEVQSYGDVKDNQLILRIPSVINYLPEKNDIFENIIKDLLYILNKNRLGFKFTLDNIINDIPPLNEYAIVNINKEMTIEDLERISQTTKITNAKISDIGDIDKLIYYTKD